MRIPFKYINGQLIILIFILALCACNSKKEELPLIPPVTSPLSKEYVGYGVITSSFTHITAEPAEDSSSLGYLRRGSLVMVLRRQLIKNSDGFTSWVQIEDIQRGWLREDVMDIYDSQEQARTASESMSR